MSDAISTLIEMGFSKERAELAILKTGTNDIQTAMDWLLSNEEQPEPEPAPVTSDSNISSVSEEAEKEDADKLEQQVAKSLKCDECGKLFKTQTEVEFHAAKSGHEQFSESAEEKQPLSEEEKKEQLAKIEAKLKQRRLEREAREKLEELEREKNRIKSGKELLEAKKKQEDLEIKKIIDQRKKEKEEERLARQRVKEQIEQDKLARKAKFGNQPVEEKTDAVPLVPVKASSSSQNYSEVKLHIRLTNGTALMQTFGAKEPLSAVRVYVEINRTDDSGPFTLMTTFPKKVFGPEDYDKPLDLLGLAPSAVLIVTRA